VIALDTSSLVAYLSNRGSRDVPLITRDAEFRHFVRVRPLELLLDRGSR